MNYKRCQDSQSQPDITTRRGVRQKTQGTDVPKPVSKPSRRLSFSALRGELTPTPTSSPTLRRSDTISPLYTSNSRGSGVVSGYTECDVCGNMLYTGNGTFAPHSGVDYRTVEFPTTFYNGGALNLDYVKLYTTYVDLLTRRSLTANPDLVGAPYTGDLFQAVLDHIAKKPVPMDSYVFADTSSYLWDMDSVLPTIITTGDRFIAIEQTAPTPAPPSLRPTRAPTFFPQSGLETGEVVGSHDVQHLTTFTDENEDWATGIQHAKDDSFYCADTGDVPLSSFFNRPLLVFNKPWGGPGTKEFIINPWSLYFDNLRVSNRLANYRNLRCNLKVKFLINGTPFDYGRLIAAYAPLHKLDTNLFPPVGVSIDPATLYSQRLHLYLDPTTSQGGTMTLPYFYYQNSLDVSKREWDNLGQISIYTIEPLRNCNGTVDPVTISVFVWAEDVVLSCPTASEPTGLLPQSGDEYGRGIVSRPAAILAKVAGRLRHVPYIGRYATAAEMGASDVAMIAQYFGMSRPNIVTDTTYTKRDETGHLSNVDRPDPIQKLTLDSKQAVTLDPRTVGLDGIDQTSIVDLAMREAYLTKFYWSQTSPTESMLFNMAVMPCTWSSTALPLSGGRLPIGLPPCAGMTLPFDFWRGSMRYRFQIVKSNFHRGRLRIVYEPGILPGITCDYNTNLSEIIDIGDNVDFCIEVGWHHTGQYLKTILPGSQPVTNIYKSSVGPTGTVVPIVAPVNLDGIMNGSLSVFVVNTLECPAPASTVINHIAILVSVAACEDFEIFQPSESLDNYTYLPQMGAEQVMTDPERAIPVGPPTLAIFGKRIPLNDKTPLICHGDPIVSIRALMKRYVYAESFTPPGTGAIGANSHWQMQMSGFPALKGKHPFGRHLLGANAANIVNLTHINYFTPMFHAYRGGIRNKFICAGAAQDLTSKTVVRANNSAYVNILQLTGTGTTASALALVRTQNKSTGFTGTAVNTVQNGLFEAEIPYSDPLRFFGARNLVAGPVSSAHPMRLEANINKGADLTTYVLDRYVAAADDFNLYWFAGIPTITYLPVRSVIS